MIMIQHLFVWLRKLWRIRSDAQLVIFAVVLGHTSRGSQNRVNPRFSISLRAWYWLKPKIQHRTVFGWRAKVEKFENGERHSFSLGSHDSHSYCEVRVSESVIVSCRNYQRISGPLSPLPSPPLVIGAGGGRWRKYMSRLPPPFLSAEPITRGPGSHGGPDIRWLCLFLECYQGRLRSFCRSNFLGAELKKSDGNADSHKISAFAFLKHFEVSKNIKLSGMDRMGTPEIW